LKREKKGGACK